MEILVIVSIAVSIICCIIEVKSFIRTYKTRKILKKTVENCLNFLKERDEL